MLKKIFLVILLAIVGVLGFAATKPDTYHVERKQMMKATPEKIINTIADLKGWTAWSPWEKLDPNMKRTYSGPESGKGAIYGWEGNKNVGKGSMEITDVKPGSRLDMDLHFLEPFASECKAAFTATAKDGQTEVVWSMDGPSNYMTKLISVFVSMDKMVGTEFAKGLADLKTVVEK